MKWHAGRLAVIRALWVFASTGKNFLNTIVGLARDRSEPRIVADQLGAPTSSRSVAEGLISLPARDDGNAIS